MSATAIRIPEPRFDEALITLRGRPPGLLPNRYSESVRATIRWREANPGKVAPKVARDPESEFADSLYVIEQANGKPAVYGFPSGAFLKAMLAAAERFSGIKNKGATFAGALVIEADLVPLRASEPIMREDVRGLQGKRTSLIYRPWFKEWEADLPMRFDADVLDLEQIVNLLARAGAQVGIGNWRPEKKGVFGTWDVVNAQVSE